MTCAVALSLFMSDFLPDDDDPHDAKIIAETRRSDKILKVLFFILLPPSKLYIIIFLTDPKENFKFTLCIIKYIHKIVNVFNNLKESYKRINYFIIIDMFAQYSKLTYVIIFGSV